jgi:hypothetical protein
MDEKKELLTTTQKARRINFDALIYGTFAEIGAGQEVAREFFHAGGASGTIARLDLRSATKASSPEMYTPSRYILSKETGYRGFVHS